MSNIEKEGQALLARLHATSGCVPSTRAGVHRVREYEAAKMAAGRFLKSLLTVDKLKTSS